MEVDTIITPPTKLKGIMMQMVFSKCLSVVAKFGIADCIGEASISPIELSQKSQTSPDVLLRIVRVLAAHGIFEIDELGNISNTESSNFLKTNQPSSQRNFVRMMGSHWMWEVFNHLEHSLTTGETAFPQAFPQAQNLFDYFNEYSPIEGKIFSKAMSDFSYSFDTVLIESYSFENFKKVVDVGGAEGQLLKTIKTHYPKIQAILFEMPHAIEQAQLKDDTNKLEFVSGDFFRFIEPKSDCIILKYILHNWNDESCIQILKNCRNSIDDNGTLLIMSMLIEPNENQVFEKSLDIVMQLLLGSKERTQTEFEALLEKSHFKLNQVIETHCPLKILEVVPT